MYLATPSPLFLLPLPIAPLLLPASIPSPPLHAPPCPVPSLHPPLPPATASSRWTRRTTSPPSSSWRITQRREDSTPRRSLAQRDAAACDPGARSRAHFPSPSLPSPPRLLPPYPFRPAGDVDPEGHAHARRGDVSYAPLAQAPACVGTGEARSAFLLHPPPPHLLLAHPLAHPLTPSPHPALPTPQGSGGRLMEAVLTERLLPNPSDEIHLW